MTIDFDNTTGLNDAKGLKDLKDPKDLIFNLAGQQIAKSTMPKKGVLVQKGKKFVIK